MGISEALEIDKNILNTQQVWPFVQNDLKQELGVDTYTSWLSKLEYISCNGNIINFNSPSRFIRDWIRSHYEKRILKSWRKYNEQVNKIHIEVINTPASTNISRHNITNQLPIKSETTTNNLLQCNLDPRFTFDNFVVGKPNELAYAAARSIAESEHAKIGSNPLFLYGGVGLGKTHLMHAIAWHIQHTNSKRKVAYLSAEKYMYQFVKSLRNKDTMNFKEQFRSVDVLMIDDVQFICGKENTQEEFFHTFNELVDNNKQVIISCDRSPSDLENMEERIKSRLGWGLVADVHSTTYELRLGILHSKIEQLKASVPQDVIEFLAAKISSNVRELEGALNKVIAHANLVGSKITIETTSNILKDLLRSNDKIVTIEEIQKKVAERFNIKLSDMSSDRRLRSIARPRQVAMYLAKTLTSRSLAEIGKKFGGKDHTTIMHAAKKIESLMVTDQELSEDIRLLHKILQG